MNDEKEKIIIENLISSTDVFSRCIAIINYSYFSPYYRNIVKFIIDYFSKYRAIPSTRIIKAETGIDLNYHPINRDEYEYTCNEIQTFCQNSALKNAILKSSSEVNKPDVNMGEILELFKKAVQISLPKDMGIEVFENPEEKLNDCLDSEHYYPTTIRDFDKLLIGLARKQLTLFSANSGGGKSIMLANLGAYYVKQGFNVLYVSLELSENMIMLRLASILSGISTRVWKTKIPEISHKITQIRESGAGSYVVKRLSTGSSANDIRSYVKQYELEYGYLPDVLIVDYLDVMHPNEGVKDYSVSERDKKISEQLTEYLHEINAIGITASQQNREGIRMSEPDQGIIAGGLTKVNTVDNYISLLMTPQMRLEGHMALFFLKTRSSDAVGNNIMLKFNPNNLIISDTEGPEIRKFVIDENIAEKNKTHRKYRKEKSKADEILRNIKNENIIVEENILNDSDAIIEMVEQVKKEKEFKSNSGLKTDLDSLIDDI